MQDGQGPGVQDEQGPGDAIVRITALSLLCPRASVSSPVKGIASDHPVGPFLGLGQPGVGVEPGLKSWAHRYLPSCQVSDLRNQVYPENRLDPFPGEGRVVGWQRIRKPSVTMEHPGELGHEAEPGGGDAGQDKLQVASSTVTHRHPPSPPQASRCPPRRLQDDCREVSEQAPQVCDPSRRGD